MPNIDKLEDLDRLPKRFHWINDFTWTRETYVQGRLRLEKQIDPSNKSFDRCSGEVHRAIFAYRNLLDDTFYYNDLSGFQETYSPATQSGAVLRNALSCVNLMRRKTRPRNTREVVLSRDVIPMVDHTWYVNCLKTLWDKNTGHAAFHTLRFLDNDYRHDESQTVCEYAYRAELTQHATTASRWLAQLALRQGNTRKADNTTRLKTLLAESPNSQQAWLTYYQTLFSRVYVHVLHDDDVFCDVDNVLSICKMQVAFAEKQNLPGVKMAMAAAFHDTYAQALHAYPSDRFVELTDLGQSLAQVLLGDALAVAKTFDIPLLEMFTMATPGSATALPLPTALDTPSFTS